MPEYRTYRTGGGAGTRRKTGEQWPRSSPSQVFVDRPTISVASSTPYGTKDAK
jgi:hypothetical protein